MSNIYNIPEYSTIYKNNAYVNSAVQNANKVTANDVERTFNDFSKYSNYLNRDIVNFKSKIKSNSITFKGHPEVSKFQLDLYNSKIKPKFEDISYLELENEINNVEQSYSKKEIIETINNITKFSNIDDYNEITDYLIKNNYTLLTDKSANIGATLGYLKQKGNFPELKVNVCDNFSSFAEKNSNKKYAVILDDSIMNMLRNPKNKFIVEAIKQNPNIVLIFPKGSIDGCNPFNISNASNLVKKAIDTIEIKNCFELESLSGSVDYCAIKDLEDLSLKDKVVIFEGADNTPSISAITDKLAYKNKFKSTPIKTFSENLKPEFKEFLEYVVDNMHLYSPRLMNKKLVEIHSNIQEFAKNKNIPNSNIFYLLPKSNELKSFHLILNSYRQLNNIPDNQIIDDIRNIPPVKNKAIVLLDDISASGDSLTRSIKQMDKFDGEVILSPVIITQNAISKIENNVVFSNSENMNLMITDKVSDVDFSKQKETEKIHNYFKDFFIANYKGGNHNIATYYMSPNNNNKWFTQSIANLFTLNGNGIKTKTDW